MRAVNKNIVVRPDKPKETSEGGIFIPDKAQDPPISGTVLLSPLEYIPTGSRVYYPNYCVKPIEKLPEFGNVHVVPGDEIILVID